MTGSAADEELAGVIKYGAHDMPAQDLTDQEIADVMDCPVGTVRSRIFRAREAIDKELKPLLE